MSKMVKFTKEELAIIKKDTEGMLATAKMFRTVTVSGPIDPLFEAMMKEDMRQDKIREDIAEKLKNI